MAVGSGAYWVGQNGRVYGNIQGIGVRDLGLASDIQKNGGIVSNQVNGGWSSSGNLNDTAHWSQIQDPNAPAGSLGASTTPARGGSGYSVGSAASKVPDISGSLNEINSEMNVLGQQQAANDANQEDAYNKTIAGLNQVMANNQKSYDTQSTQNAQDLAHARQTTRSTGAAGARSLMSQLAALGVSGSGTQDASRMVADQMNKEFGQSNDTSNKNMASLGTWLDQIKQKDAADRGDAEDTLRNNRIANAQQAAKARQSLLKTMADTYNSANRTAEANNALNQAAGLNGQIAQGDRQAKSFHGSTANTPAPTLAANNPQASLTNNQQTTQSANSQPSEANATNQTNALSAREAAKQQQQAQIMA